MQFRNFAIATFILSALLACATSSNIKSEPKGVAAFKDDPRLGEKVEKICFNRNIDSFSDNRNRTVVLKKGVNDHYLIEVLGVCQNLNFAQSIAVDSTLSCVRKGDYLIVSDSAFSLDDGVGIGPDRCAIKEIYKWDKDAEMAEDES